MFYWILPWNSRRFNLSGCLEKFNGQVTWRQQNNFSVGDIVFLYCSLPVGRITHMFEVLQTNVSYSMDDEEFFIKEVDWHKRHAKKGYVRLKLVSISDISNGLTLAALVEMGMKKNVQRGIHVEGQLLNFILSGFDIRIQSKSNKFSEGTSHIVTQTYYERDPQARLECLKYYGNKYKCEICGFNFRDVYGDIGNEFIHVHHINFLAGNNGKSVNTNPKKDLIPVCPNCHSMLHRKLNGSYLNPEELKQRLKLLR